MRSDIPAPAWRARLCISILALAAASSLGARSLATVSTLAGRTQFGAADGIGRKAGFANPYGVASDGWGNVYVADTLNHTIRRISPDGAVTTIAGKAGEPGSVDGAGPVARFHSPQGIAVDHSGTVFVTDTGNRTIRSISPSGEVRTIAGHAGVSGDADGLGDAALFRFPAGLAVGASGMLFVADSDSATIRSIAPTGEVRTLAGVAGEFGIEDGVGAAARFTRPVGVAIDGAGNLYVTDLTAETVRVVDPTGYVSTLAGKPHEAGSADGVGAAARFNSPAGIAVDGSGAVYVADEFNFTIRRLQPPGLVSTLAGRAGQAGDTDGSIQEALFGQPVAVAVTPGGVIIVSDLGDSAIRAIQSGAVSTLAGDASRGDRDGPVHEARFDGPQGIAVDIKGNIFVSDTGNETIRVVMSDGAVHTLAGRAGEGGSSDGPGNVARFRTPNGIALDHAGNVYVADEGNRSIRRIAPDGTTVTLANAGSGLITPTSVAVDAAGNIYVTDLDNHTVDRIAATGGLTVWAGSASQRGTDDGVGAAARFEDPYRVAVDDNGIVYVADLNGTIRRISPAAGVTTLAGQPDLREFRDGTGRDARFVYPEALTVDSLGNLFVSDDGATIRQVTPEGRVTTLAGQPTIVGGVDGPGNDARFALPNGIAVDRSAHLYIADTYNNAIREVDSATRLVNLSVRGRVGTADQTPIMGFVVSGSAPKSVLMRGIGPGLQPLGVAGATSDPALKLFNNSGNLVHENDDWGGTASLQQLFEASGAFPLDPGSKDAALFTAVPGGLYTVHTTAANNDGGVVLMEIYDADQDSGSRLTNLSARMYAGQGDETLITGFVLSGAMPKQVLLRVAGPSLAPLGVGASGLLPDPKLTLFEGPTRIAENDDWDATPELKKVFLDVGAFEFASDDSKDAAIAITLQPGLYTVHASAATGGAGVALIEIYEVP